MESGSICSNPAPRNIPPAKAFQNIKFSWPPLLSDLFKGNNPPNIPAAIIRIIVMALNRIMSMILVFLKDKNYLKGLYYHFFKKTI